MMCSRLLGLPVDTSAYGAAGLVAALVIAVKLTQRSKVGIVWISQSVLPDLSGSLPQLDAIPTVGSSSWFGPWWGSIRYLTNVLDLIQEGYEKASRALVHCMRAHHELRRLAQKSAIQGSSSLQLDGHHQQSQARRRDTRRSRRYAIVPGRHQRRESPFFAIDQLILNVTNNSNFRSSIPWALGFTITPIMSRFCAHN